MVATSASATRDASVGWSSIPVSYTHLDVYKRQAYVDAVNEMVDRTDHKGAPWDLIAAESKHYARVAVLETVCRRLEKGLVNCGIQVPTSKGADYGA